MHQGFLVPCDDLMTEAMGQSKEQQAADGHAFGEVNTARELIDAHFHFAPRSNDRGEPALGGNTGQ